MDKEAHTVTPKSPLIEALAPLCHSNRIISVVDEQGKFVGVISSSTVIMATKLV